MAGRTFLSMDQTASARESIFWHQRECRQNPNMDRGVGLRPRCNHPQAAQSFPQPLRDSTNFEREPIRENPARYTTYAFPESPGAGGIRQPIDSVRLTLGHA